MEQSNQSVSWYTYQSGIRGDKWLWLSAKDPDLSFTATNTELMLVEVLVITLLTC